MIYHQVFVKILLENTKIKNGEAKIPAFEHTSVFLNHLCYDMFLRRMRRTENAAREELRLIQDKHRDWEESLISVLGEVLDHTTEEEDATFGKQVRKILNDKGGVDTLKGIYEKVSAYHHNNF